MLVSCGREQGMDNILYVLERADKFVYHYTKPQSLAKFLPTGHIRFSRFTCTNDPRECKDWKLGLWTPEGCKDAARQSGSSQVEQAEGKVFARHRDRKASKIISLTSTRNRGHAAPLT